jgi:hypothetical protein
MINAEIILQQGDKLQRGKVKRRSIDDNGKTMALSLAWRMKASGLNPQGSQWWKVRWKGL